MNGKAYKFSQLGAMYKGNNFGPLCIRPTGAIALIQSWKYIIKQSVKSKSRKFYDGFPLAGKSVQYGNIMQPVLTNMDSTFLLTCLQLWDI